MRSRNVLGPASVLVPAVAIVVVVVGMTCAMWWWPYPEWVQTSSQFHQQFAFGGMIAGTATCWHATVLHARDRIWLQPGAARAGLPVVIHHVAMLTCWFLGAYLIALLPLVVSTAITGGIGAVDPLAMLSGVVAMVAAVALGYALGAVVPHLAVVAVLPVGFYALLVAGNAGGDRFASVSPVLHIEPRLGNWESVPLVVFRIALFIVVAAAAVGLAGKSLYRRVRGRAQVWRTAFDVIGFVAVPAVLVAVSLVRQPIVFIDDARPAVCIERRDMDYCVHAENRPRLDELVRVVDPVLVRFGTRPDNLTQVRDYALISRKEYFELTPDIEIAYLEPDGTTQADVAIQLAGIYACDNDAPQEIRLFSSSVYHFLTTGERIDGLSGMPADDVRRWLAQHQKQLHDCTLTRDQLPGERT